MQIFVTVKDESGNLLPGATISVNGYAVGATGDDGIYNLTSAVESDEVTVTYTGYQPSTSPAGIFGSEAFVTLQPASSTLPSVVVTPQKKFPWALVLGGAGAVYLLSSGNNNRVSGIGKLDKTEKTLLIGGGLAAVLLYVMQMKNTTTSATSTGYQTASQVVSSGSSSNGFLSVASSLPSLISSFSNLFSSFSGGSGSSGYSTAGDGYDTSGSSYENDYGDYSNVAGIPRILGRIGDAQPTSQLMEMPDPTMDPEGYATWVNQQNYASANAQPAGYSLTSTQAFEKNVLPLLLAGGAALVLVPALLSPAGKKKSVGKASDWIIPAAVVVGGYLVINKLIPSLSGSADNADNNDQVDANNSSAVSASLQQAVAAGGSQTLTDAKLSGMANSIFENYDNPDNIQNLVIQVNTSVDLFKLIQFFGTKKASLSAWSTCAFFGFNCQSFDMDSWLQAILTPVQLQTVNMYLSNQGINYYF